MTAHLLCVLLYLCPPLPAKPMPGEFRGFDEAEALEDAHLAATRIANAATEQREAEASYRINELLDTWTLQP
jgi:hypothetical protein